MKCEYAIYDYFKIAHKMLIQDHLQLKTSIFLEDIVYSLTVYFLNAALSFKVEEIDVFL